MVAIRAVSFALFAISSVNALAVVRRDAPSGYDTELLEPYDQYHSRYIALGCENQHGNSTFFNACCHPMLASEQLESARPSWCIPSSTTSTTSSAKATSTPSASPKADAQTDASTSTSQTYTGGHGTWFYQNGVAGACGTVHSDSDMIVALDVDRYGDTGERSQYCGKWVQITSNGKTHSAVIADACPTCDNANSLDMSEGLFQQFASLDVGLIEISWYFLD